jgi:hypothetical protein
VLAPGWDAVLRLDWSRAANERAVLSTYPYDLDMVGQDDWQVKW